MKYTSSNTHNTPTLLKSFFFLGFLFFFSACSQDETFITIHPEKEEIVQTFEIDAEVESNRESNVRFQKSGEIIKIYVNENQEVKKGDILAELDSQKLKIEVQKAVSGLQMAQARLNEKYASPTKETIALSNTEIKNASLQEEHIKTQYINVKKLNKQKISVAKQEIKIIETQLENAKTTYKNIQEKGIVDISKTEKQKIDALEDAKKQSIDTLNAIEKSVSLAKSFLDPESDAIKRKYFYIGAQSEAKQKYTKNEYQKLLVLLNANKSDIESLIEEWNGENSKKSFILLKNIAVDTKSLLDSLYELMDLSVTTATLSSADLERFKTQIDQERQFLTQQISEIRDMQQVIETTILNIEGGDIAVELEINNALNNIAELENKLLLAQQNLESLKIQNDIEKKSLLQQHETQEIVLEKAQENHNKLLAKPRDIDVAELKANISQQQSYVQQAQENLNDSFLYAPFDGVISDIAYEIGENISSSQNIMTIISQDLQIKALIPEIDIIKVSKQKEVIVLLDALDKKEKITGKIQSIGMTGIEIQGAIYYEATIEISEEDISKYSIKDGMTGSVSVTIENKIPSLLIPQSAVEYDNGKYFVYVEDKENKDSSSNKIKKIITTGIKNKDKIEVLSGLNENDSVIIWE